MTEVVEKKNPTQVNHILTFLEQFHIDNGRIYKIHPIHDDFAASATGIVLDIKNNIHIDKQPICGHFKIIVGERLTHVMLLAHFVFECFYGVLPPGFFITHKNGCKKDNNLENLQLKHVNQLSIAELTQFTMLNDDLRDSISTIRMADSKINCKNLWRDALYEMEKKKLKKLMMTWRKS